MNGEYARHKKFIMDVLRAVDTDKISDIVSYYIPFRASKTMKDLSDDKILNAVKMITKTELDEIYPTLYRKGSGLSDHEIIFRIKRVKYVKAMNESIDFVLTPPIINLAKDTDTTFINHLDIENLRVVKMENTNEEKPKRQKLDREKVLNFALENVKWHGRDGHTNNGTMRPEDARKALAEQGIHLQAFQIREILRDYYKDKPLPENSEAEETKED